MELDARIRELHERNALLSGASGSPDFAERAVLSSTPDQVAKARSLAWAANMRALEAVRRTAMMRLHAASAHDRAAQLHELLADCGHGDMLEHRERAAVHRQQANDDRAAAARLFGSQHVDLPETGHS